MAKRKQWKEMNRGEKTLGIAGLVVIAFIVIGIIGAIAGSGSKKSSSVKSSSTVSASKPATVSSTQPATSTTSPTTPTITGYGALLAEWNANHKEDTRYAANSVYDPDPSLGNDIRYDAKYYTVSTTGGRVLNYSMRLPNESNQALAQAEVMQEFPSDVSVLWQKAQTSDPSSACYQMEVKSATLGTALSAPAIGDTGGEVFVEFYTDTPQNANLNSAYTASNVNGAILQLGSYQTAADAPGC